MSFCDCITSCCVEDEEKKKTKREKSRIEASRRHYANQGNNAYRGNTAHHSNNAYRGNNLCNDLEYSLDNYSADVKPIMEQPRCEPNSSPVNHYDITKSQSGHLGTISYGSCSTTKNSSDHPNALNDHVSSDHCILHDDVGNNDGDQRGCDFGGGDSGGGDCGGGDSGGGDCGGGD